MIYQGNRYKINKKVIDLPERFKDEHYPKIKENYVRFGRITTDGVNTDYSCNGKPVFATPIDIEYWSLTNLAYGKDGRVYLMYDGRCYTRKLQMKTKIGYSKKYKISKKLGIVEIVKLGDSDKEWIGIRDTDGGGAFIDPEDIDSLIKILIKFKNFINKKEFLISVGEYFKDKDVSVNKGE